MKNQDLNPNPELPWVLYVENDVFSTMLVKKVLDDVCQVDIAPTGLDALDCVKNKNYKIILMDINLGIGMDGIETTQLIRKIPEYADTPVVAITSYALQGHKNEFLSKGCTHYLSKPINIHLFKNMILDILGV